MKRKLFTVIITVAAICAGCNEQASNTPSQQDQYQSTASLKPQAVEIIENALSSNQAAIRNAAIEIVAVTKQNQLMPIVAKLTTDEFVAVRFAAAIAIGDTKYKSAKPALNELLYDKNPNAQIAAAYALSKLDDSEYRHIIAKALKSKNQTLRANAALLIGKLGDKGDLKLLYSAMSDINSNDLVRLQTVESIAMLGDKNIYKTLWALLISKYSDDKIIGIRAMSMIKTSDAHDSIVTMLNDPDPWVRMAAAGQLAKKGDIIGKDLVIEHLKDIPKSIKDSNVKNADILAVEAIGRFNDNDVKAFLPNLINSRSTIIQLNAAWSVLMEKK